MSGARRARAARAVSLCCAGALAALIGARPAGGQGLPVVSPAVANQHVVKRVAAAYPAIAKAAQIQGIVVFQITVGQAGEVTHMVYVGGPPLLVYAAKEAVSQWRFRPFLVNGKPTAVNTQVHVFFLLASGKKQLSQEEHEAMAYFDALARCRSLLAVRKYSDAAQPCSGLPQMAAMLPDKGYWEQGDADRFAGLLASEQGDYSEAVALLRRGISLRNRPQVVGDLDLGDAYRGLGAAYEGLGRLKKAASAYKHAISDYKRAMGDRDSGFGQDRSGNMKSLVALLRQYAGVLQKLGRTKDAARATQEADKLASEIHP